MHLLIGAILDHTKNIDALVGDFLTIEKEISGQKTEQKQIRRAIRALGGLETLNKAKADFKADQQKEAKK